MKKIYNVIKLMSIVTILFSAKMYGQCFGITTWGSGILNSAAPGTSVTLSTASWGGDSIPVTFNVTGAFTFSSSVSTDYVTITDNAHNVIVFGNQPLVATIPSTGLYYAHYSASGPPSCNISQVGRTTSVFVPLPGCTGMPVAGTVPANYSICPNSITNITATGATAATAITYQWMQAPAASGPWTNVTTGSGFNTPSLTTSSLTSLTFYQMVITCTNSSQSATTSIVSVNPNNAPSMCYCTTGLGGSGCSASDIITNVSILNTPFNNNSTCTTTPGGDAYSVFPQGPTTTATLNQGASYSISVNTTANNIESVWIDFNKNGMYEASEHTQICTVSTPSAATIAVFNVPATASLGVTGMRVRSRGVGSPNGPTDACTQFFSGETEDYIVTIAAGVPCAGAPASNTIIASLNNICPGLSTNLSLTNTYTTTGISYQWFSASSSSGPYSAISSATLTSYTTPSLITTTWYQLVATCTNGPASTTVTPLSVVVQSVTINSVPYFEGFEGITVNDQLPNCSWSASSPTTICKTYTATTNNYNQIPQSGSKFASFRWGTNTNGDYFYSNGIQLTAGITYSASAGYITDGFSGWSEFSLLYGTSQSTTGLTNIASVTGAITNITYNTVGNTFTVPTTGVYYIAVKCIGSSNPWYLSWDNLSVTIPPVCSGAPASNTIIASVNNICPGLSTNLSLANSYTTAGISYQWFSASSSSGPYSAISSATLSSYTTPSLMTTTWYQLVATCSSGPASTTVTPLSVVVQSVTINSVPYFEGFEGITVNNQLPNCSWSASALGTICKTYTATTNNYNQIPQSGSKFASFRYGTNTNGDYFYSNGIQLVAGTTYSASAGYITDGFSGWSEFSLLYGTSQSTTGLTNIASVTGAITNVTYNTLSNTFTVPTTGVYYIAVKCIGSFSPWYLSWDDLSITAPPVCTGAPAANISASSNASVCVGGSTTLSLTTSYAFAGVNYQWYSSPNSSGPYTLMSGANTSSYLETNINAATWYQAVITCASSALSTTATPVQVAMLGALQYASVPFLEAFDNVWQNRCDNHNVPVAANWDSNPSTGDQSWRRQDDGATALWTNPSSGIVTPIGVGSADFHTWDAPNGTSGDIMLYVNLNSTNTYSLSFYHVNEDGDDSLEVFLSIDGGATYSKKGGFVSGDFSPIDFNWNKKTILLTSVNSPTCVIKFKGTSDWGVSDIGIDSVQIKSACAVPNLSLTASQATICNGNPATLTASGATTYTWNTNAQTASISVTPSVNTTYTVNGENTPGCPGTKTIAITVNPSPTLTVAASPSICPGGNAVLSATSSASNYTWTPGNLTTSAITVSPSISSVYNVVTTNTLGCSTNSNITVFVIVCTGIAKNTVIDNNTFIYPNPNSGNINVVIQDANGNYSFEVLDLAGRIVYKTTLSSAENALSIKELANGMYTYKITSLTTKVAVKEGKLIKE